MKTYEIIPNNGRKSFYGKAIAKEYNGNTILTSYTTEVAKIDKEGRFSRLWGGYSVTTMNHVNAFRAMFGLPTMTKKEWERMEVDRYNPLVDMVIDYNRNYGN